MLANLRAANQKAVQPSANGQNMPGAQFNASVQNTVPPHYAYPTVPPVVKASSVLSADAHVPGLKTMNQARQSPAPVVRLPHTQPSLLPQNTPTPARSQGIKQEQSNSSRGNISEQSGRGLASSTLQAQPNVLAPA